MRPWTDYRRQDRTFVELEPCPERGAIHDTLVPRSPDEEQEDNLRAMYNASANGDLDALKRTIRPGVDLNTLFESDQSAYTPYTALHAAVQVGHVHIVGFLLAIGADPEQGSYYGDIRPIHVAASDCRVEAARILLDHGVDIEAVCVTCIIDGGPMTPLWMAMHRYSWYPWACRPSKGKAEMIDLLIARGAKYPPAQPSKPHYNTGERFTHYHPKIPKTEQELFKMALDSGSTLLWKSYVGSFDPAPPQDFLRIAIEKQNVECFQLLMHEHGMRDDDGAALTAAWWEPKYNISVEKIRAQVDIARRVLDTRANFGPWDAYLATVLCSFASRANLELMALLLDKGLDVNAVSLDGLTVILAACGSLDTYYEIAIMAIEFLQEHGANLYAKAQKVERETDPAIVPGNTTLHQWARRKDLALLEYLLKAGADPNATNDRGETPLMRLAIEMSQWNDYDVADATNAARALIEAGDDINAVDNRGRSALHHISDRFDYAQNPRILGTLVLMLKAGADPDLVDADGKRPADLFSTADGVSPEVRDMLQKGDFKPPLDCEWEDGEYAALVASYFHAKTSAATS